MATDPSPILQCSRFDAEWPGNEASQKWTLRRRRAYSCFGGNFRAGWNHTGICIYISGSALLIQCLRGRVGEMERQWRNPSDVMKTRSIRKKKVRPHTCWLCSLIVLARVKITLSSCVQLQRASSLGGLNKENSPLKSVNRSVNESGAVRKRTAGIALGEQENCPRALTATRTKNSSICSPSTKVHWPNTANYSLHDTPQVLCACSCHEHT